MAEFTSAFALSNNSRTRATMLERLRDGSDLVAWEEFFGRYWSLIFAFARRRGCSEHTAEEVVQDVMLKVFEQKDLFRYDPSRGRFRSWLGTLVTNRVADFRRMPGERARAKGGDSNDNALEAVANQASPEDDWTEAFEQSMLLVLLDVVRHEMSPRAYLAFELSTLHGLAGGEVARHTGLTRNGVYRARKRALARLRELGAAYRRDGHLGEQLEKAVRMRPDAAVERSLCTRIEQTMRSVQEFSDK
ncbi:MAG: sigma-70 family RNA polymerase sigma factor [Pirellulales bacterium]|nr:sigma-70 family RNA polymerase sigma factor [Pirellulales bacterium]